MMLRIFSKLFNKMPAHCIVLSVWMVSFFPPLLGVAADTSYEMELTNYPVRNYQAGFPGERLDIRTGSLYHESEILTLPGAGGFDLNGTSLSKRHRNKSIFSSTSASSGGHVYESTFAPQFSFS